MKEQNLFVRSDGTIYTIGDPPAHLEDLGSAVKHRASTIVPLNPVKCVAFWLLRGAFGEEGRVADWTRTWNGQWMATIKATNQKAVFTTRQNAVKWEYERLEELLESQSQ